MTKSSVSGHTESRDPHVLEWLTGMVSAACVLAMIGWIGVQAIAAALDEAAQTVERS